MLTTETYKGIEVCRQSCGGAGFLSASGFHQQLSFYSPMITFEGDNTVMIQQASRYLFKLLKRAGKGKKPIEMPFTYLNKVNALVSGQLRSSASSVADFANFKTLEEALQVRVLYQLLTLAQCMQKLQAEGKKQIELINDVFAQEINNVTTQHLKLVALTLYIHQLSQFNFKNA